MTSYAAGSGNAERYGCVTGCPGHVSVATE